MIYSECGFWFHSEYFLLLMDNQDALNPKIISDFVILQLN